MTDKEIIKVLEGRMGAKRFNHSLCVAEEARRLAQKYGADGDRLYTAGLLHDITKETSCEEQLKIFSDSAIMLTDIEKGAIKLWHAISGSAYCRTVLGITDEEILSAIRYHTTAKAGMTKFQKILYIADFTSADRTYPGVGEVRAAADRSIEEAMAEGLAFTINDLSANKKAIHPDTFEAYNEIMILEKEVLK